MPAYNIISLGIYNEYLEYVGDVLLVEDGHIKSLGRRASYASDYKVNGYVLPSFVDAHLHITWIGLLENGVDLSDTKSPDEVGKYMTLAKGPIAYGRGWDQESFTERGMFPTRDILDKYVANRPAIAVRICGHMAVVNSLTLSLTRVDDIYPNLVDKEKGLVYEHAVEFVIEKLLEMVDIKSIVKIGLEKIYSHGIGGVSSMACPLSEAEALRELERSLGRLPVRIACYPRGKDFAKAKNVLEGSVYVELTGVKEFADGSLGARTAYLSKEYSDDPGNKGIKLLSKKEIINIGRDLISRGYKIAIHAIGDAALDEVLDAYEELDPGDNGRIEHASITRPDQIRRLSQLGIHVVVQPHFRISDWWISERVGGNRLPWVYPFKSMSRSGVRLAFSTDAPIEPLDPGETIRAAESRCKEVACREEEALSRKESIYYYTRGSADASGGAISRLGRIDIGAPASLIWTRADPKNTDILKNFNWIKYIK